MVIVKVYNDLWEFYRKRASFKRHKRLKVFWLKGFKCVHCGIEGNCIIHWKQSKKHSHFDLFHIDEGGRILMTVDHIIPKSLGGKWNMENLQPMCTKCNHKKGDTLCLPMMVTV